MHMLSIGKITLKVLTTRDHRDTIGSVTTFPSVDYLIDGAVL